MVHWSKNPQMREKVLKKIVGTQFKKGQPSSKGMLGKKHTENWKIKQSKRMKEDYKSGKKINAMLRKEPWNKGKKLHYVVWNKGTKGIMKPNKTSFKEGEHNKNWQGGISFKPYNKLFNNKFKRLIRKRDNQVCMICGVHREKLNRALAIHHINYDKKMSIPQNCISLCDSCHIKTNHNRKHWIKFLQNLLKEKYNYQYSQDREIALVIG